MNTLISSQPRAKRRAYARVVYHAGSMTDLNDVVNNLNGWRLSIGYRINDYEEIVPWVRNDTTEQGQLAVLLPILD